MTDGNKTTELRGVMNQPITRLLIKNGVNIEDAAREAAAIFGHWAE